MHRFQEVDELLKIMHTSQNFPLRSTLTSACATRILQDFRNNQQGLSMTNISNFPLRMEIQSFLYLPCKFLSCYCEMVYMAFSKSQSLDVSLLENPTKLLKATKRVLFTKKFRASLTIPLPVYRHQPFFLVPQP